MISSTTPQNRAHKTPQKTRACVIWLTGYSGAGKTTIAHILCNHLRSHGTACALLDGDVVRDGLCSDLGFSRVDRAENVRRVAEVARLMVDVGLVVMVALISPFRDDRALARARFAGGAFVEVFVDTPLSVAEARDVKGLYRRARQGLVPEFTGIDSPYEQPLQPEVHLETASAPADECAMQILQWLQLTR